MTLHHLTRGCVLIAVCECGHKADLDCRGLLLPSARLQTSRISRHRRGWWVLIAFSVSYTQNLRPGVRTAEAVVAPRSMPIIAASGVSSLTSRCSALVWR